MTIRRLETLYIPQTKEGRKFAKQYEDNLKKNTIFFKKQEGTNYIIMELDYWVELENNLFENRNNYFE